MDKLKRASDHSLSNDDYRAIVKRANDGDRAALRQLQAILDEHPHLWQSYGDLANNAELALVRLIAGNDALLSESLTRSVKALRKKLSPPRPSPLEELLIGRVVTTWMRVQFIETNYVSTADLSVPERKFALQQRESAQWLFDAAVKSLRTVQDKLGRLPSPTTGPSKTTHEPFRLVRPAV